MQHTTTFSNASPSQLKTSLYHNFCFLLSYSPDPTSCLLSTKTWQVLVFFVFIVYGYNRWFREGLWPSNFTNFTKFCIQVLTLYSPPQSLFPLPLSQFPHTLLSTISFPCWAKIHLVDQFYWTSSIVLAICSLLFFSLYPTFVLVALMT